MSNPGVASFLSFAGFAYGETVARADRILGRPHKVMDELRYSTVTSCYFPAGFEAYGFEISFKRETGLIRDLKIGTGEAVYRLRSKGVFDPNLSYLGQHRGVIEGSFGNPTSSSNDHFQYELFRPESKVFDGTVTFICYDFNNYVCSEIEVTWFLGR